MNIPLEKQLTKWLKQQKKSCGFFLNLTVTFGVLTGLSLLVQAYLIASIIHNIVILELPTQVLSNQFIALLCLIPVRALLAFARERTSFEAGKRLRLQIRQQVLDKLCELGPAYIKGKPAGSWATIVLEQIEDLHDFYARYLPQMLLAGFIPMTILIAVFPLNWAAGLILLTTAPLIPIFMILVGKGAADANRKNFKVLTQLSGHFMDRLKGLKTLKLFNQGETELKNIESASESFRAGTMAVLRLAFLSSAVLEFFAAISIAVLAVYFGFSFLGELNFGHYGESITLFIGVFVLMLAPEFYQPLRDMGTHYHAKAQAIGAAEALKELLDYQIPHQQQSDTENAHAIDTEQALTLQATELCVYSLDGSLLVGPISFTVDPAQDVALVGPSGSGKTSLLNALLGFLPYQGSLLVNGVELSNIDKAQWRKNLAWLGQDPQLFYGSVRENISMGDSTVTDGTIKTYLQQVAIWDFIEQKPLGLNHPIGEQMSGLSVGQAQRIALARALTKNAQLFLLDEPTASLDQDSERVIFNTIQDATQDMTSIMISHRLDQLQHMDNIIVMDQGKIVQQGDFQTLNKTSGLFNDMQQDMSHLDSAILMNSQAEI
ncbi:cysteine/glutathione ABC transporter permease/ATP-binding protein CydD [Psychromonas sp. 14N.309.X.WAT.B.A12]|uniref:heme ABC transporter permease/ATP-binding protein CydD n=1 Tax=Psychromonas sp. 14N.309.X.WAT.B.A12 TaxID=2998322 RepID=UPI0025AEF0F1|nr:cysteine/glutathione ABC transporter permease/ATP-binding protein CydD [Psychromonas sp. 14N.309.X.WAT.B.A12]MDN2663948.1 cysteine/glutathione ABC transporter permease/ATP-binding protein CydD [Psychromonas sp. 14N.309.X.WAT.B.A12]